MFIAPQLFIDAVDKLGSRLPIASELNSAEWREMPTALRERAFFSATITNARFLQDAQNMLLDNIKAARGINDKGESYLKVDRNKFIQTMRDFALKNGMGPLNPKDEGTIKDIRSVGRLGLIFDINIQAAHDYGYWKQGMDPDVLEAFPAQRFIRARHVKKPRPYHVANTGAVRRKDDLKFWLAMNPDFGVPWGPWGYGSGMDVEDVNRSESESLHLVKRGEKMQPVDRSFNEGLSASARGLSQGIRDQLKDIFGDQIEVGGDEVHWTGHAPAPPTPPLPVPVPPAPKAPASVIHANLDAMIKSIAANPAQITPQEAGKALQALQRGDALPASAKLGSISVSPTLKSGPWEQLARTAIDDFMGMIPPKVAQRLPQFDVAIKRKLGNNALGLYNPHTQLLSLQGANVPPAQFRSTVIHELTHWLHLHGPQAYQDLVEDFFDIRTQGEPVQSLPGYNSSVHGKKDNFWDAYMGRMYRGIVNGSEIPTRTFELLVDPMDFAVQWNKPAGRETMRLVYSILFP